MKKKIDARFARTKARFDEAAINAALIKNNAAWLSRIEETFVTLPWSIDSLKKFVPKK